MRLADRQDGGSRLAAMPGPVKTTLVAGLCTVALAGCGGSDGTIPSQDSDQLLSLLDALRSDVENSRCDLVAGHAQELASAVDSLPESVDPEVRKGVSQATAQIVELSQDPDQCASTTGASGPAEATSTSTTEPETTSTTTTTTEEATSTDETTSEETTTDEQPTDETTTDEQPPPDQGNGEGNQGNGLGNGGPASGGITGGKRP